MPSNILNVVPHDAYLLQYNNFAFDPASTYTESLNSRPEQDSAKRTIKFVRTQLSVVSKVFRPPPTTTDTAMEALERQLMSQGGALYYRDKGFGNFNINTPGGQKRDVAWGPIPTHFNAKPLADAYCWEIRWGVEVCIPWCDAARFEKDVMEWNYQVYYDYDDAKYETRRIFGHIEIPLTRQAQGDRLIRASADDYREVIAPAVPPFFRPGPSNFNLSEDRRRLTFNFAFVQMPGPVPPPGILKISMSDSLSTSNCYLSRYTWGVRAQYEMVYGFPHYLAAKHFLTATSNIAFQMVKEMEAARIARGTDKANDGAGEGGGTPNWQRGAKVGGVVGGVIGGIIGGSSGGGKMSSQRPENDTKFTFIPVDFSAENPDRYGPPRANFAASWAVCGMAPGFLMAGLWTQFDNDNNWSQWVTAAKNVFGPRGVAGSKFNPNDDVIIDLCRPGASSINSKPPKVSRLVTKELLTTYGGIPIVVDPDSTWIKLVNRLELKQTDSVMVHKPLPEDRTLTSRGGGVSSLHTPGGGGSNGAMSPAVGAYKDFIPPEDMTAPGFRPRSSEVGGEYASTIGRQAASTYTVLMIGHAVRVGFPPDPLTLLSVGGVPAVSANDEELGDGFKMQTMGNVGFPIYIATWQYRYVFPAGPTTTPKDASTDALLTGAPGPTPQTPPKPSSTMTSSGGAGAGGGLPGGMRRY